MAVDDAMAALRAARADGEKTPGKRPSPAEFEIAAEDLRAAGVSGTVAVVRPIGAPQLVGERTGIVPVMEAESSTLVFETTDEPGPRLLARRLIARGKDAARVIRVDEDSFVLQGIASAVLFPTLDAVPIEFAATATKPTKRGWVAFFAGDEGWVLDANTGKEILPRTHGLDAISAAWTHEERWLSACESSHPDAPAVVIDVTTGKELFRSREAKGDSISACAIDDASGDLAIVYYNDEAQTLTLEAWDLATGKQRTTKVIAKTYIPELLLEMETATHSVTVVSAPYQGSRSLHGRYDLHTGAALQARKDPSPPKPPKPAPSTKPVDPVAHIPVGQAEFTTELGAPLRGLASPGKELVSCYFDRSAGWFANGALSQDRASLALLEDDASATGTAPALLVVDVATLKVRHRIGLRAGYRWAMVAFLDPNTIVARLEWHYWLIDASTGAILGSAEHDGPVLVGDHENPFLLGPNVAVIGTRLFDVRRGLPDGYDRELAPPFASPQIVGFSVKGDEEVFDYLDRYALSIAKNGAVTFARAAVPDWLVCIVKDEVFPYEACAGWTPGAAQDR